MRVKEYKNKNNNNNKIHHHAKTIFTKRGRVAETRNVITLSKFQIN